MRERNLEGVQNLTQASCGPRSVSAHPGLAAASAPRTHSASHYEHSAESGWFPFHYSLTISNHNTTLHLRKLNVPSRGSIAQLLGWGSLIAAAGVSYYYARQSINERRKAQEVAGARPSEKLDCE